MRWMRAWAQGSAADIMDASANSSNTQNPERFMELPALQPSDKRSGQNCHLTPRPSP